ncbi:MAG: hypothetical protein ACR2MF_10320 [Chthoniobacterales bacterium]
MNEALSDAYERFQKKIRKPAVAIENYDLVFSDDSDEGYHYPLAKIDAQYPLWDLFAQPWFTEQHASAAAPFVRWELDRRAKSEAREADRERGLS